MAAGRLLAGVLALVPAAAAAASPWAAIRTPTEGGAEALGSPTAGCLSGGRPLAFDGPGFEVVRVSRRRYFGHPSLVAYVEDLGRAARHAGLGTLVIGDLAQPRGGPIPGGHASHQTGLDARWAVFGFSQLRRHAHRHCGHLVARHAVGSDVVEHLVALHKNVVGTVHQKAIDEPA